MTQTDLFDDKFPPGFELWLSKNKPIYNSFVGKALAMSYKRDRYSARTIAESIRWESDLRDSNNLFKINNNWVPGMARLAMREYPKLKGFFTCRDSQGLDE